MGFKMVGPDFESGGSGMGVSWHIDAASCPRRRQLRDKIKRYREANGLPVEHDYTEWFAADKGTVFHWLVQHYHLGTHAPEEGLVVPCPEAKPAFDEGIRLFHGYRQHFSPSFWGEVIGTEVKLHSEGRPEDAPPYVVPVTIDLVSRIKEEHIPQIEEKCSLRGIEPGIYLLDHKTKSKKPTNLHGAFGGSIQGLTYQAVYNQAHPEEPCKGMIFNLVVAHKELRLIDEGPRKPKSFWQFLQRASEPKDLEMLGSFFLSARALYETKFPNVSQCDAYSGCPFYRDGDRTCLLEEV